MARCFVGSRLSGCFSYVWRKRCPRPASYCPHFRTRSLTTFLTSVGDLGIYIYIYKRLATRRATLLKAASVRALCDSFSTRSSPFSEGSILRHYSSFVLISAHVHVYIRGWAYAMRSCCCVTGWCPKNRRKLKKWWVIVVIFYYLFSDSESHGAFRYASASVKTGVWSCPIVST